MKKKLGLFTIITSFIWGAICVYNSYLIGATIDALLLGVTDPIKGSYLAIQSIFILILSVLTGWFLTTITIYMMGLYSALISQKIKSIAFRALQNQSAKFFDKNSTGDLVSKATNDTTILRQFLGDFILLGPIAISEFIFCLGFIFYIDIQLGLLCLLSIPISIFISHYVKKDYGPTFSESREKLGKVTKVVTENVEGSMISRVFDSRQKDVDRFDKENLSYLTTMLKAQRLRARISPTAGYIMIFTWFMILGYGGFRVINGSLSIGMLISATFLTSWLAVPVRHVTNLMVQGNQAKAATDRISDITDNIPEIIDSPNPVKLDENISGKIVFKNVSFGYHTEAVLKNVDFAIPAGSTVALLGGTGSGKSSLINLIPRFYDTTEGSIEIDGINIKNISLTSLRRHIGFVDQESFLFNCSIRENIAFGKPNADMEEIKEAARFACVDQFIEELPDKFDTNVGERGITLSGGQRQRISIARTLLANPKIVIFDDSLSAVDIKTEREIEKALNNLLEHHTTIIVTQRLSATKNADFCIIVHDGQIAELGSHEELLTKNSIYSHLYKSQVNDVMDLSVLTELEVK